MPPSAGAGRKEQSDIDNDPRQKELIVRDAYDRIFDSAMNQLECKDRIRCVTQRAIQECISCCQTVVEMAYPQRESEPISEVAIAHGSWESEAAPEPCAVDTWMRSAIPEVEKPPPASPLASMKSMSMRDSNFGHRKSVAAEELVVSPERLGRSVSRSISPKSRLAAVTVDQKQAEERLREELEGRKAQAAVVQKMAQKDEESRAKLTALQNQLKGKDYSYNHKGEVVVLSKLDPDKMPSSLAPELRVATPPGKRSDGSQTQPSPSKSPTKTGKGKMAHGVDGSKTYSDSEFKELPDYTQPSPLETMKLTGGVMLRHGDKMRRGPGRTASPSTEQKMSRRDFQEYARTTERRDTIVSDRVSTPQQQPQQPSTSKASTTLPSLRADLRVDAVQAPESPSRSPTKRAPGQLSQDQYDINMALTASPDWGSNTGSTQRGFNPPVVLPKAKPGVKERAAEVGAGRFPRARIPHATLSGSLRGGTDK